jgi:acetate---CoA ligase (ADP-forming) subunit beta
VPAVMNEIEDLLSQASANGQQALSEYASKRVLASCGVPVVDETLAANAEDAAAAAERIGYPVVIKACSPALMHKSDRGLVKLNVNDTRDVALAIAEIDRALDGATIDGYLVQRMVQGKREVIVGGMRDKLFGPCVMLGLGGILVEALADVSFRLAPLEERDALEMINQLRAQNLFDAIRGEPAVDRAALSRVLIAVGTILLEHSRISQIDVNPLIFQGADPIAVDALVTLK